MIPRQQFIFWLFGLFILSACGDDYLDSSELSLPADGDTDDQVSEDGDIDEPEDDAEPPFPLYNDWEITEACPLLDDNGELSAWGWARHPYMEYNPALVIEEDRERIKEWDWYGVTGEEFYIELTLADISWMTMAAVSFTNYRTGETKNNILLGSDSELLDMRPNPYDDMAYGKDRTRVSVENKDGERHISFYFPHSAILGPEISAELVFSDDPEDDSMVTAMPFENMHRFFYTDKIVGLPATGTLSVDGTTYEFTEGKAWGILDWGRGVWPEQFEWGWAVAGGSVDGGRLGLNFGFGEEDNSRGYANAAVYNGTLHKLGKIDWSYNADDVMQPWHFSSEDGRFEMTLTPYFDQSNWLNLGAYSTDTTKVHGYLNGHVILDDGTILECLDLIGFAEHCFQQW